MNISDNYVGIFVSTILLSYSLFIIQLQPTYNVRSYETVNHLYIYSVYNQVRVVNTPNSYVIIFIYLSCLIPEVPSLGLNQHSMLSFLHLCYRICSQNNP